MSDFWQEVAEAWKHAAEEWQTTCHQAIAERDEAREIARELAEYTKALLGDCNAQASYMALHGFADPWPNAARVYGRIRPGVRRWLEE